MDQQFMEQHWKNTEGHPAGGVSTGTGFTISWQNGPLGRGVDRIEPNGAFVEGVIGAVIGRLEFYQGSQFKCEENEKALNALRAARDVLNNRTARREDQGTEGTHAGS